MKNVSSLNKKANILSVALSAAVFFLPLQIQAFTSRSYEPHTSYSYEPSSSTSHNTSTSFSYTPSSSFSYTSGTSASYQPSTSFSYTPGTSTIYSPGNYDSQFFVTSPYYISGTNLGGYYYGTGSWYYPTTFSTQYYSTSSPYYIPSSRTPDVVGPIITTPHTPEGQPAVNVISTEVETPEGELAGLTSVYLDQVPYTGTEDVLKVAGFISLILIWSAAVAAYFLKDYKKKRVSNKIQAFKEANKARLSV